VTSFLFNYFENIYTFRKLFWTKTFHLFTVLFGQASSLRHIFGQTPSISAHKTTSVAVWASRFITRTATRSQILFLKLLSINWFKEYVQRFSSFLWFSVPGMILECVIKETNSSKCTSWMYQFYIEATCFGYRKEVVIRQQKWSKFKKLFIYKFHVIINIFSGRILGLTNVVIYISTYVCCL